MSNSLAIATVTATLQSMLTNPSSGVTASLPPDVPLSLNLDNTKVTTKSPDKARSPGDTTNQINLFLYQTTANGALRNMDMPHQIKPGEMGQPPAALNLHYLVTAYGNEDDDIAAHILLGQAVRIFHDNAVLSRSEIGNALPGNGLHEQVERVRITPAAMSLEEMSKLWTTFQTQYRISAAYDVSVVLIESTRPTRAALPVRTRNIRVLPFRQPLIEAVSPQVIAPGGKLTIQGHNLKGDVTKVRFDSLEPVDADTVLNDQIEVILPPNLLAGIHTVQVMHLLDFGTGAPSEPHRGFESNLAAFILAPQITTAPPISAAAGASLSLSFTPPAGRTQRVMLLIGDQTIPIPSRPPEDPPTATSLDFSIPSDFPTGEFLLRLRVDGADSPLEVDSDPLSPTFNQYVGPKVTIT